MPTTLEQINGQITGIEYLSQQDPVPVTAMLEVIDDALFNIGALFTIYDYVKRLSGGGISGEEEYRALRAFLARLRPLVQPYISEPTYSGLMRNIVGNLPSLEKEESYIYQLTKKAATATISARRTYIPQSFVGLVNIRELGDLITEFTFMATHGLGPCVGYVLYLRNAQCCALAHFDDLLNVTGKKATPETLERAADHYRNCGQEILAQMKNFSENAKIAKDWSIILLPSSSQFSLKLRDLLQPALTSEELKVTSMEPVRHDEARSVLIELAQIVSPEELQPRSYVEIVPFADLPANLLTLREALHLPPTGFALYHIQESALVPQDVNQPFSMVDNYVTPRPLTAGVAAIPDRVVAKPPPPGGASAVAASEITAEPAIDDAAKPQQSPEAASSSAGGVRRPFLMSPQAAAATGPQRRERSTESNADDHTVEDALSDSDGSTQDRPGGGPPRKRHRPGGNASNK